MTGSLDGRSAFVTGAGSGVGRAVAVRYAAAGARVHAFDVDPAGLEETVRMASDSSITPFVGDVRDPASLRAAVDVATRSGPIDVLAAIAGVSRSALLLDMSDEDRDFVFDVNVKGVWNSVKAVLPSMLDAPTGGRILVCGSVECILGGASLAAYVASKHAVLGLVKSLALELAKTSITVNAISPAGVDTAMLRKIVPPEDMDHIARTTPIDRLVSPDEIAAFFEFVAGPETGYMTGENVVIDGGLKLVNAHTSGTKWAVGLSGPNGRNAH
ncbi:SDR family NAD(P)-dependent oxidoreductase [Rhodococcus sp. Eu-32]|uniref:SDR family NAD(P)-dependent oxidoreductase n=1 Tax=Rhodococcus sp. Eu-32 TaxID=1017319 RepID=UPI001401D61A|nr:SDR family NAD(P)-dependent oxidoreductase [Rhodococcus sp. Eu-32]